MTEAGFYRIGSDRELMFGPGRLVSPSGTYRATDHAKYRYPIDGSWIWADSEREARAALGLPQQMGKADRDVLEPVLMRLSTKARAEVQKAMDRDPDASVVAEVKL